jgi:hypothetical protein
MDSEAIEAVAAAWSFDAPLTPGRVARFMTSDSLQLGWDALSASTDSGESLLPVLRCPMMRAISARVLHAIGACLLLRDQTSQEEAIRSFCL